MNTFQVIGDRLIESDLCAVRLVREVERKIEAALATSRDCPVCEEPMLPDSLRRDDELAFTDDGILVHRGCLPRVCSMCGATEHTEREQTNDGEWDEDCVFRAYFDGDGNDLRRTRSAW